jgi:hypothetical protein
MALSMSMKRTSYPTGVLLGGGAYVVGERLAGDVHGGVYRGTGPGGRPVLVTLGGPQSSPPDRLRLDLALEVEGISPLLHLERLTAPELGELDVLVEAEPAGVPLSSRPLPLDVETALRLLLDLGAVVARVHAAGRALGVLHPDQTWVDERVVTVAPRARLFLATAATGDVRRLPLSRSLFEAPEMLAGARATPACDVFSLAAILAVLASGEHPFEGAGEPAQALAISMDRRRPWRGPGALGDLIGAALRPEPAARPSLPDLLAPLRL